MALCKGKAAASQKGVGAGGPGMCVFEIEGKALCVGAGLVPARLAAEFGPPGDHKGRPYERNFG
jgi:hypothetical protein